MPEAVALVPIDGFQTVGFPMSVVFLLRPKSSDLVSREGERGLIIYVLPVFHLKMRGSPGYNKKAQ